MEIIATLSQEDKKDIAVMVAEMLLPKINGKADDELLTTKEAMALLKINSRSSFLKFRQKHRIKEIGGGKEKKYLKSKLLATAA